MPGKRRAADPQPCGDCGEADAICPCGCCGQCCIDCDELENELENELFDADELGLDPEDDDLRKYGRYQGE